MAKQAFLLLVIALLFSGGRRMVEGRRFTLINKCRYDVWAAALTNAYAPPLPATGFYLPVGNITDVQVPEKWSGHFWGRTECLTARSGRLICFTGDCRSGNLNCSGGAAYPPSNRIEFNLNLADGNDWYRASVADGFNLPFGVLPEGGKGGCGVTGCPADVNALCPKELRLNYGNGSTAGCNTACNVWKTAEQCCKGEFGRVDKCKPKHSELFKKACPLAHSNPFDNLSTTFTCVNPSRYYLVFCP